MRHNHRRARALAATLLGLAVGFGGLAAPAAGEFLDPSAVEKIDPPVTTAGPILDRYALCTADGFSLKIAKALKAILGKDLVLDNQPVAGESGYNEHAMVIIAQADYLSWHVGDNANLGLDDYVKDPKRIKYLNGQVDALKKAKQPDGPITYPNGDTLTIWCLAKNDKHGGPVLALYYKPKDKPGVWIGLDNVAGGSSQVYVKTDGAGNPVTIQFMVYAQPQDKTDAAVLVLSFDVATGKLTTERIWGRWKFEGGKWKFGPPGDPKLTPVKETAPAPEKLEDLKLDGKNLASNTGGCTDPAQIVALAAELLTELATVPTSTDPDPTLTPGAARQAEPTDTSTAPEPSSTPTYPWPSDTYTPDPTPTYPWPSDTYTYTPDPTPTYPQPTDSPTADPSPTETPDPTDTPGPTETPDPTGSPEPTGALDPAGGTELTTRAEVALILVAANAVLTAR